MTFGAESGGQSFPGLYRALVVDVRDPEKRGRVRATVHGALQEEPGSVWIEPAFLGAGTNRGLFWPPEEGDAIQVGFQYGNPERPEVYIGGWYGRAELPPELGYDAAGLPRKRGFVTRGGHMVVFDDTPGAERIVVSWHASAPGDAFRTRRSVAANRATGSTATFTFDTAGLHLVASDGSKVEVLASGEIRVEAAGGAKITLTPEGVTVEATSRVTLKAPMVKVDATSVELGSGAVHPSVRGDVLMGWLATHTHGGGPPTMPLPLNTVCPRVRIP